MSLLATAVLIWLVGLPAAILVFAFLVARADRGRNPVRLAAAMRPSCRGARGSAAAPRPMTGRRIGIPHSRG